MHFKRFVSAFVLGTLLWFAICALAALVGGWFNARGGEIDWGSIAKMAIGVGAFVGVLLGFGFGASAACNAYLEDPDRRRSRAMDMVVGIYEASGCISGLTLVAIIVTAVVLGGRGLATTYTVVRGDVTEIDRVYDIVLLSDEVSTTEEGRVLLPSEKEVGYSNPSGVDLELWEQVILAEASWQVPDELVMEDSHLQLEFKKVSWSDAASQTTYQADGLGLQVQAKMLVSDDTALGKHEIVLLLPGLKILTSNYEIVPVISNGLDLWEKDRIPISFQVYESSTSKVLGTITAHGAAWVTLVLVIVSMLTASMAVSRQMSKGERS